MYWELREPIEPWEKRCKRCGEIKPACEFTKTRNYFNPNCRRCCNEIRSEQYHNNPEVRERRLVISRNSQSPAKQRNRHLKRKFGITLEEYGEMVAIQAGVCAICGKEGIQGRQFGAIGLVVDHDHETGAVRGLLCHHCNVALGHFHDDTALMRKAIGYVQRHRQVAKAA